VGSRVTLELEDLFAGVTAALDSATASGALPGLRWLESQDRLCSASTVCDRRFITGETLNTALLQIDPSALDLTGLRSPWSGFIDHEPVAVWLSRVTRLRIDEPWETLHHDR
jgi:hypothetical protein